MARMAYAARKQRRADRLREIARTVSRRLMADQLKPEYADHQGTPNALCVADAVSPNVAEILTRYPHQVRVRVASTALAPIVRAGDELYLSPLFEHEHLKHGVVVLGYDYNWQDGTPLALGIIARRTDGQLYVCWELERENGCWTPLASVLVLAVSTAHQYRPDTRNPARFHMVGAEGAVRRPLVGVPE